ncbi:hypothetical protein ANCCEY_04987 [Ancylostoma ceylanicum]|uniref:Uncharacterized protein n=1 Tax=Ancylostoma ceylanicum TaxID=53326 RepID=A0A0D6M0Q8_9BILA|nr:hypothetical protein ANCCEY_04987 [Ancylostoma ceylanicum]
MAFEYRLNYEQPKAVILCMNVKWNCLSTFEMLDIIATRIMGDVVRRNGSTEDHAHDFDYITMLNGLEVNVMDDLASELGRRKRTAWGAYKSIENLVKKTKNIRLRAHLFNTTVLPALTMHFCTVLTFSLSLLIAYSSGFEYTYGKYRPIRRAFEDDLPSKFSHGDPPRSQPAQSDRNRRSSPVQLPKFKILAAALHGDMLVLRSLISMREILLFSSLTPMKYRRGGLDAYGDLSTMMRSIDELQRPRFGRK